MEHQNSSLLYPSEGARIRELTRKTPIASREVCQALGLTHLLGLKNGSPEQFLTDDAEIIAYRQATLRDVRENPLVEETLSSLLPLLWDIKELRELGREVENASGESYLYSITEIELYIACITALEGGLCPISDKLESEAMKNLAKFVSELVASEEYKHLVLEIEKLSSKMHQVRSVTVGVNLDGQFRPTEAGVVSVNSEPFHSGKTLDKILRMSFKNDSRTCIASLTPFGKGQSDNRKEALVGAFNGAMLEVFRSSVKGWRGVVSEYVLDNTNFLLEMLPEIEFVCRGVAAEKKLLELGFGTVCPTLCPKAAKAFSAKGLYHADVALKIDTPIVKNDFAFEENTTIFVITGPNRGGKSVLTTAVGLAQAMAQLGMLIPADEATISPVDQILTHFPDGAEDTLDRGRLGEECNRLRQIFETMTEDSLVLLDESLSSTGAFEATYIAADVLLGFGIGKVRSIFSTHLHDLASKVPQISQTSVAQGGAGMDTMTAELNADGSRSFRVVRGTPDGKSYAKDIAKKYGLGQEDILGMVKK